ncbi:MAG: invasion associated locus B family protein [Alphaproteobacteria bacterium]|nr:invasion associated locus B family protein [Alphaproteobacteria bacterium]MBU6473367.1 invasion associated locus B family protein [Alphaproteobacteria bacterium]MDE2011979.1 invasion associated locus B family protein [Alphaproteobacteria bacterium]
MNETKPARTIGLAVGALAAGLFLGWLARGLLTAPHDALTVASYGDWRLTCPPRAKAEDSCILSEDVLDQRSNSILMRLTLGHLKTKPILNVVVPFNVLLPTGIAIHVGDSSVKTIGYKTCDNGGCLATLSGDTAFYDSVLGAAQLGVEFSDLSGKSTTVPLSTKGLNEAAAAMRAADAKRQSWLRRAFL